MKRGMNLALAALLLASAGAHAGDNGWYGSLELANLDVGRSNLDFLITGEDGGNSIFGPNGRIQGLDPQSDTRIGLTVGFAHSSGWRVGASFSSMESDDRRTLVDAGCDLAGTCDWAATRIHADESSDIAEGDFEFASSMYNVEIDTLAVEVSRIFSPNANTRLRPMFGIQTATIDERMNTIYSELADQSGDITRVNQSNETDAMGVVVGTEATWQINDRFSVFGGMRAAVMMGDEDRSFFEDEPDDAEVNVDVTSEDALALLNFDARVGVGYRLLKRDKGNLDLRLAYTASTWNGQAEFIDFPDDVVDSKLSRGNGSMVLDGISLMLVFGD